MEKSVFFFIKAETLVVCDSPLCGWALRKQKIAADVSPKFHRGLKQYR